MNTSSNVRNVCLFGASPDTGNRGVTALCHSVLWHLHSRDVKQITVFDHGRGLRKTEVPFGAESVPIRLCGAIHTKRLYRSEALWQIRLATWAGGAFNPAAKAIHDADAILDVSAGDSFTDLYGKHRFQTVMMPKQIAIDAGKPLVFLPQTYGPFQSPQARLTAAKVLRRAAMAWARDQDSYAALQTLLGSHFDPVRHRCGVDMAFALPAIMPSNLPMQLARWFSPAGRAEQEVIGLNVSGLIYNDPETATEQFGLRANYRGLVNGFLTWLMTNTDVRVVLIPHVMAPSGNPESDYDAACHLVSSLETSIRDRIVICPPDYSPSELKWIISQTSWFAGTRMHSTIAALSSSVPSAAASYSLKTRGVYESCGHEHQVFELRHQSTDEILHQFKLSFNRRHADRERLAVRVPAVIEQSRAQLDEILDFVGQHTGSLRGA